MDECDWLISPMGLTNCAHGCIACTQPIKGGIQKDAHTRTIGFECAIGGAISTAIHLAMSWAILTVVFTIDFYACDRVDFDSDSSIDLTMKTFIFYGRHIRQPNKRRSHEFASIRLHTFASANRNFPALCCWRGIMARIHRNRSSF